MVSPNTLANGRVYNFSPGPSTMPLPALRRAQEELLNFQGTGISILEHSHRGKDYSAVHAEAKSLVRELYALPDDYEVLFMQGGASAQFAILPMNYLSEGASADYIVTGTWSEKAIAEAKIVGTAKVAATTAEGKSYTRVPTQQELSLDPSAAYCHLTTNNTIFGTQFHAFPDTAGVPLVADMSSDILSAPMDLRPFGLIYAGAQKNLGPAGLTLVIVRKDFLEKSSERIPKIFRYKTIAAADSLQNTIPTFAVYLLRNVAAWVKEEGGLPAIEKRNREKSGMIYGLVDEMSDFYRCPVEVSSRSIMNAVFRLPSEELEAKFLKEAASQGMVNLKGHRSVGGVRVSMYNAMPVEGVAKLAEFMRFRKVGLKARGP